MNPNNRGNNPWMMDWFHRRDETTKNAILTFQKAARYSNKPPPAKRNPPPPPDSIAMQRANAQRGNSQRGRGGASGRGRYSNRGRNTNFGNNARITTRRGRSRLADPWTIVEIE